MHIAESIQLAPYTTLKVGGPARYLVTVGKTEDIEPVRTLIMSTASPVLVLGHGSNVLIPDTGYGGIVVRNQIMGRQYKKDADDAILATFGAGEDWDACVADSVARGYWGLENLSHIPGTVGATPIQNVGAYGVEVSQLIVSVAAVSLTTGETKTFTTVGCQFAYRDSYFKTDAGRNWLITHVTYRLSRSDKAAVLSYADLQTFATTHTHVTAADIRQEIIRIRSAKFPNWQAVGTAGSFFKNPVVAPTTLAPLLRQHPDLPHYPQLDGSVKVSLGWILDHVCGLRGYTDGEVSLSPHQALVLINRGGSAAKIVDFVQHVTTVVHDHTGITIEPEVRLL